MPRSSALGLRFATFGCAALAFVACDSTTDGSGATSDIGVADADATSDTPPVEAPTVCGVVREANQIGRGGVRGTALNDEAVFVLGDGGLEVYGPSGGERIGEWRLPTDRQGMALALDGERVLVVSRFIGVWEGEHEEDEEGRDPEMDPEEAPLRAHLIDVSAADAPVETGAMVVPADPESGWLVVALSGDRGAIRVGSMDSANLLLFDLADPARPTLGAELWFGWDETAHDIELVGQTLYVSGVSRTDVPPDPDPGPDPEPIPEDKGGEAVGFATAYVGAWDVSDASDPTRLARRTVAPEDFGEQNPQTRVVADEGAVVLSFYGRVADRQRSVGGLCAFEPEDLTPIGEASIEDFPEALHVHDGTAWVALNNELHAFAIFESMRLLSDDPLPSDRTGATLSGRGPRVATVERGQLQVVTLGPGSFEVDAFPIGRLGMSTATSVALDGSRARGRRQ